MTTQTVIRIHKDTTNIDTTGCDQNITLSGTITTDLTLKACNNYLLEGEVYVDNGATLIIEPGTIIKGDAETEGTLIILRGSKIMAQGTPAAPIVFTSEKAPGERTFGDWGGVIVCGRAPVNEPGDPEVEGIENVVFGGTDPDDNSGVISYVRIEFAGIALFSNQEINGLTLAGVGRGTQVDHVQVSVSGDDAFEMFGGTVNASHLVAFLTKDDCFDSDLGYQGHGQFFLSVRNSNFADQSKSNGFESDNDASGTDVKPNTAPVFSNVTLVGPYETQTTNANELFQNGVAVGKRSRLSIFNSLIMGWEYGVRIDGKSTVENYDGADEEGQMRHNIVAGWRRGTPTKPGAVAVSNVESTLGSTFKAVEWFMAPAYANDTIYLNTDVMLTDPFNTAAPNPMPMTGSPALSGADFTHPYLQDAFIQSVDYRGAFGTVNWLEGWTNFDPQMTDY